MLIVRDIAFDGKHTYKEFLESEERIATNVLSDRLKRLEQNGILVKQQKPEDRRIMMYALTEKGIGLIPALFALSNWSYQYDPDTDADPKVAAQFDRDPLGTVDAAQRSVRYDQTGLGLAVDSDTG